MIFGQESLNIYAAVDGKPIMSFANLDKLFTLKKEFGGDAIFEDLTLLGNSENYHDELEMIHAKLSNPKLKLCKRTRTGQTSYSEQVISIRDFIEEILTICSDASKRISRRLDKNNQKNIAVLKELLSFVDELSSKTFEPEKADQRKSPKEYPLIIIFNKEELGNSRLIVNPRLKEEAHRCLNCHSVGSNLDDLKASRNAVMSGDPRVIEIGLDNEGYRQQTKIKYGDHLSHNAQPNWHQEAIDHLEGLVATSP